MPYTAEQLELAKQLAALEIAKEKEYSKLTKFPHLKEAVRSQNVAPTAQPIEEIPVSVQSGGDELEYRFQRPQYYPTLDFPGNTGPMEYEGSDWYLNPKIEKDSTSNPAAPTIGDEPIKQPKRGPRYIKERGPFEPLPVYKI